MSDLIQDMRDLAALIETLPGPHTSKDIAWAIRHVVNGQKP